MTKKIVEPKPIFTTRFVKSEDLNHHGTLFAGRTAEWVVEAGFIAAASLINPKCIACLKIHGMHFSKPVRPGEILKFTSKIVYTGKTSLTAFISVTKGENDEEMVSSYITFINVDEINYIEADGNYLTLHTTNSKNLYRDTITNIAEKLNPEIFVRIHRSYIVKIENIKEMQSHFNSEYIITLKDNTKIKSGRSYKAEVDKLLKH